MKILMGPLEPFQFERLKPLFEPKHCLVPLLMSFQEVYSQGFGLGALSEAFNQAYDPSLDVIVNLDARVEVDWTRFSSQLRIGIPANELKRSIEAVSHCSSYDAVLCKGDSGHGFLQRYGIESSRIVHLPEGDPDPESKLLKGREQYLWHHGLDLPDDHQPFLFDVAFLGNLYNDTVCERYDRQRTLEVLWRAQRQNPSLRVFVHRDQMLTPPQVAESLRTCKAVFRGGLYREGGVTTHGMFPLQVWQLRRPVLLWYVKPGESAGFQTLRDGENCIFYHESNIEERLQELAADEPRRLEIVRGGCESIAALTDEIYDAFAQSILSVAENLNSVQEKKAQKCRRSSASGASKAVLALADQYAGHYRGYSLSPIAALSSRLGAPYLRVGPELDAALAAYCTAVQGIRIKLPDDVARAMLDFGYELAVGTQLATDALRSEATHAAVLEQIQEARHRAARWLPDVRSAVANTPFQAVSQAYQLFRPFTGPRDRKFFHEIDHIVGHYTNPENLGSALVDFLYRYLTELWGDAAILAQDSSMAAQFYLESAKLLEKAYPSYRTRLKLGLIEQSEQAIIAAAEEGLAREPLNTMYATILERFPVSGDPRHPGEGFNPVDIAVFQRLASGMPKNSLQVAMQRELYLEGLLLALASSASTRGRGPVGRIKLAWNMLRTPRVRHEMRRIISPQAEERFRYTPRSLFRLAAIVFPGISRMGGRPARVLRRSFRLLRESASA